MIRTILTLTVALLVWQPLLASPSAACISCEYKPEVINTPVGKAGKKKARDTAAKARSIKKRVPSQVAVPKVEPKSVEPKVVETKAEPVETYTASKKPVSAPTEPVGGSQPDSGSAAVAAASTPPASPEPSKPVEEAKAPEELGCKKFIPTAGITVSVACE